MSLYQLLCWSTFSQNILLFQHFKWIVIGLWVPWFLMRSPHKYSLLFTCKHIPIYVCKTCDLSLSKWFSLAVLLYYWITIYEFILFVFLENIGLLCQCIWETSRHSSDFLLGSFLCCLSCSDSRIKNVRPLDIVLQIPGSVEVFHDFFVLFFFRKDHFYDLLLHVLMLSCATPILVWSPFSEFSSLILFSGSNTSILFFIWFLLSLIIEHGYNSYSKILHNSNICPFLGLAAADFLSQEKMCHIFIVFHMLSNFRLHLNILNVVLWDWILLKFLWEKMLWFCC